MNVAPVLPARAKAREGVLDAPGLGRIAVPRPPRLNPRRQLRKLAPPRALRGRLRRLGRASILAPGVVQTLGSWNDSAQTELGLGKLNLKRLAPHRQLMKHAPHKLLKRKHRKGGGVKGAIARLQAKAPAVMPTGVVPLAGYGDDGLGKLKLGKKLRKVGKGLKKVVKSKIFKYAAIGAAAYFTGGLALKAAPAIMGKGKIVGGLFKGGRKLLSRKNRQAAADAAQTYAAAQGVPVAPGSEADVYGGGGGYGGGASADYGYGGGGGGGYQAAGFAPSDDEGGGAGSSGEAPDLMKLLVPLAIGIPIVMSLSKGRR